MSVQSIDISIHSDLIFAKICLKRIHPVGYNSKRDLFGKKNREVDFRVGLNTANEPAGSAR